jgi:hypothetical protein
MMNFARIDIENQELLDTYEEENTQLRKALQGLYLLVKHETLLPESAVNGVESTDGIDEGVVRASEIIEEARKLLEDK